MKETKREKVINYLKSAGYKIIGSRSRKYVPMAKSPDGPKKYFVGKNGALRVGKTISNSISISRRIGKYL